ncbi:hypothetical protein [Raoultella ornithinolytica]|uniref:hypothetical protein n=1 Tax=Raoultella ornithinolytica TaxID=54291 RepID=UPI0006970A96
MYSLNGFAAFNENESEQLFAINNKSQKKVDEIVSSLNDTQMEQIKNNPEITTQINELRHSWDITIEKRCALETVEFKGADAEISAVNDCLVKGYKEELDYFSNMLP